MLLKFLRTQVLDKSMDIQDIKSIAIGIIIGVITGLALFFVLKPVFGDSSLITLVFSIIVAAIVYLLLKFQEKKSGKKLGGVNSNLAAVGLFLGVFIAVGIFLLVSTPIASVISGTPITFESQEYGFKVTYPATWKMYEESQGTDYGLILSKLDETKKAEKILTVITSQTPAGISLDESFNRLTEGQDVLAQAYGFSMTGSSKTTFKGLNAYKITGSTVTSDLVDLPTEMILVVYGENIYFLSSVPDFDDAEISNILDSFEFI